MTLPLAHLTGIYAFVELAPMLIAAALYAKRASTLASRGRSVPVWRQLCFAAGLLLIVVVLVTPISDVADELVIAHMIEHLLIGDIASLFIVLGLTGPLLQPVLATVPLPHALVLPGVSTPPAGGAAAVGDQLLRLALPAALRRRLRWRPGARARARHLHLLRLPDVDADLRAAAEAGLVHRRLESRL